MLPLENEMKTPKAFGGTFGVLNKAMVVIVFLYVGMGFFGYLNYGDDIKGSITLNLPPQDMYIKLDLLIVQIRLLLILLLLEKLYSLAQCVKGMLAFAIFITHGLACYVAIDITWTDYLVQRLGSGPRKVFWEYVVRTGLVLVTCKCIYIYKY